MARSAQEKRTVRGVLLDSIEDFSGGLNTLYAPNGIAPNQAAAMSNVWLDTGTLKKMPGTGAVITYAYGGVNGTNYTMACPYDTVLNAIETLFMGSAYQDNSTTGNATLYYQGSSLALCSYSTGTVSNGGTTTMTGTGTFWQSVAGVQSGDAFLLPGTAGNYVVQSVISDTQLTVDYVASTVTGSTYNISPASGYFYNTGTITWANNSATITGAGTSWIGTVQVGDNLQAMYNGQQVAFTTVASINSNTSITATTTNTSGTSLAGALYFIVPAQPRCSFATINNTTYLANGTMPLRALTPSTFTTVSSSPQAKFLLAAQNYIFSLNILGFRSRIQWSGIQSGTIWPATNYIDISPNDGFDASGMFFDGQSIVIFKEKGVYKLTGNVFDPANPTYTLTPVYAPPSALWIYPNSIQFVPELGGWVIFGGDGLYLYNGSSYIQRLDFSTIIQSEWNKALPWIQSQVWGSAWAIYWQSKYRLSLGTTIPMDKFITIERDGKSFWEGARNSGLAVGAPVVYNQALYYVGGNGVAGGSGTGFLQLADTGSYWDGAGAGTAINGSWTSKVYDYNTNQAFGRCWVDFKNQAAGNLVLSYSIDEGAFNNVNVDMTYKGQGGGATRVRSPEILIGQEGQSIQFKVSNNVAGQDFEVYAISWERKPLRN